MVGVLKHAKGCKFGCKHPNIDWYACRSTQRGVKMADKKLKITLVKSTIGAVPKNKATVQSMGLRKIGSSVVLPDNDATRGQIRQVGYLLKVEEA